MGGGGGGEVFYTSPLRITCMQKKRGGEGVQITCKWKAHALC